MSKPHIPAKRAAALAVILAGLAVLPSEALAACVAQPVSCRISSPFGWRLHPVKKVQKLHRGTDFACPVGTPVNSATAGNVIFSGWDNGGGNLVKIRAGQMETKYMHNSRNVAQIGQSVPQGTEIARTGNTGAWTTGPHLHFELWVSGRPVDPMAASCSGGDVPLPPPDANDSGGVVVQGGGGGQGEGSQHYGWEQRDGLDGSFWDMLGGIVGSRALNPDYARQIGLVGETRLYEEFNYLRGVRARVDFERQQALARMARNQALIQALKNEDAALAALDAQRKAAIASQGHAAH